MKVEITDSDIAYAEALLLPTACSFNDERRAFIRSMESRDVVACPGSGKTTALLAKLLILARKMPFADGRGICVLTHTNVAIGEIKEKAGIASASLFLYPNFFATIHSFVGTFFALPAYVDLFGHRQVRIDDSLYEQRASSRFDKNLDGNGAIYHQLKNQLAGKVWSEQREIKRQFFSDIALRFDNGYVTYVRGDDGKTIVKGCAKPCQSYKPIHAVKYGLLKDGYLRFRDVFPLASLRINNISGIPEIISSRFAFVFVDEMQDSDEEQSQILDALFPQSGDTIVQRIGDPNQAIFHSRVHSIEYWFPRNPLHFSDSRRYGDSISRLLASVRLKDSITLQPCKSINSLPLHIITFSAGEEKKVLRAFSYLINELSGTLPPSGIYKAVGWIGKDDVCDGRLCIPAYFPCFERKSESVNRLFTNLISFSACAIQVARSDGAGHYLDVILQGVACLLVSANIKDDISGRSYTSLSVRRFWRHEYEKSYFEFRKRMAECFLLVLNANETPTKLRNYIRSSVVDVWPGLSNTSFLDDDNLDPTPGMSSGVSEPSNQYAAPNGIVIDVGTVHSVKGETHCGTLYLETDYQKSSDSQRLVEFLEGHRPSTQLGKAFHQQNLKVAHVAFSRPTHLVAFACLESHIVGHEDSLRKNGWVLRTVSDLISEEGS